MTWLLAIVYDEVLTCEKWEKKLPLLMDEMDVFIAPWDHQWMLFHGKSLQFLYFFILRTKVTTDILAKWVFKKFTKLQEEQSLRS